MTHATGRLRIRYATPREAEAVAAALAPENAPHVQGRVEGADVVAEAHADAVGRLLHTLDDFLACLSAAEKAVELIPREP